MLNSFKRVFIDIFFDTVLSPPLSENILPQDLTGHYQKEIEDMSIDTVLVATQYSNVQYQIEQYKYQSDRQLSQYFVDLLSKLLDKYPEIITNETLIVPVPMHWSRYFIRGFNHMNRIAHGLGKKKELGVIFPLHARISRRQSQLTKQKRKKNRQHAYVLDMRVSLPKHILLLDDVISTGSTVNACAKILKSAGVTRVDAIFIASNQ